MTQDELKLVLEALKEAQTNDDGMEKWDRNKKAIAVVEKALAQPEQEPVATLFGSLPVYDTHPPQRIEQELIAYLYNMGYKAGHHDTLEGTYIDIFRQDMSTYHSDVVSEWLEDEGYTTPPQRTWVGLTDEEIDLVCVGLWSGGWRKKAMQDFAKVIEAKLKQVNGYAEEKNT